MAISGPRRSGLTRHVSALIPNWQNDTNVGSVRKTVDLRQYPDASSLLREIATILKLETIPQDANELSRSFLESSRKKVGMWFFQNFHVASDDTQNLLLESCLNRELPHGTSSLANFVLEGALDFEEAAEITNCIQPHVAHTETTTPWRTVVEVEQLISSISPAHYPRSLVVWLADLTRGDTGFCSEFLLRLSNPTPTANVVESAYQSIVSRGSTSRELRELASNFNRATIEKLLSGTIIPGLRPPDGNPELTELYLAGISEYHSLVGGYVLRSPMVGDALRAGGEWSSHSGPLPPGTACCSHVLWQAADAEILLRTILRGNNSHEEALSEIKVASPWKGKAAIIKGEFSKIIQGLDIDEEVQSSLMTVFSKLLKEHLPDNFPAIESAKFALSRAKPAEGLALIDGMTFSDLANLARSLEVVTTEEREELNRVNARRNDAAHFRAVGYDDAYQLEQIIRLLLPQINSRSVEATSTEDQ